MKPRIVNLIEKKLVGKNLIMSLENYKIAELWKDFIPRRKEINNTLSDDLISMVVYNPNHFLDFKPTNEFEKWAAAEVSNFDNVPSNMQTFTLCGGLYAVFDYKGLNTDDSIYRYIFGDWINNSDYTIDNRPHFEILGEKYKNNDPNSEEEIWIPIK